jgi:hypothetical protein
MDQQYFVYGRILCGHFFYNHFLHSPFYTVIFHMGHFLYDHFLYGRYCADMLFFGYPIK